MKGQRQDMRIIKTDEATVRVGGRVICPVCQREEHLCHTIIICKECFRYAKNKRKEEDNG